MIVLGLLVAAILQALPGAAIDIAVRSEAGPVSGAQVIAGGKTVETDADGHVTLPVAGGAVRRHPATRRLTEEHEHE